MFASSLFLGPIFKLIAVGEQLILAVLGLLETFDELLKLVHDNIVLVIIVSLAHPYGLGCLRKLNHIFAELAHPALYLARGCLLIGGIPVEIGRREHVDGLQFQPLLLI